MKIAVTAANGQLGKAIVNALKEELGAKSVVGIVRTPEKAKNLGIEVRKGDYNSKEEFLESLKGIDRLLLVSGMDLPEKRIGQHRNVIEAAKENGVEKIVYTSIIGDEHQSGFKPIVKSNRQTEQDIRNSGMDWAIGRNGIYIEPDIEYLDHYIKAGEISNSAGEGKCGYTTRAELGFAYAKLLTSDSLKGQVFNLCGQCISQTELANLFNEVFDTKLSYKPLTVEEYKKERIQALGDFIGTVIAGIYEGIQLGANEVNSNFEEVTGREHLSPKAMIQSLEQNT